MKTEKKIKDEILALKDQSTINVNFVNGNCKESMHCLKTKDAKKRK